MSRIKVQRGVPVPPPPRQNKYPWEFMQADDSFFLPVHSRKLQSSVLNAGNQWCARHRSSWKVETRRVGKGLRVWLRRRDGDRGN